MKAYILPDTVMLISLLYNEYQVRYDKPRLSDSAQINEKSKNSQSALGGTNNNGRGMCNTFLEMVWTQ